MRIGHDPISLVLLGVGNTYKRETYGDIVTRANHGNIEVRRHDGSLFQGNHVIAHVEGVIRKAIPIQNYEEKRSRAPPIADTDDVDVIATFIRNGTAILGAVHGRGVDDFVIDTFNQLGGFVEVHVVVADTRDFRHLLLGCSRLIIYCCFDIRKAGGFQVLLAFDYPKRRRCRAREIAIVRGYRRRIGARLANRVYRRAIELVGRPVKGASVVVDSMRPHAKVDEGAFEV